MRCEERGWGLWLAGKDCVTIAGGKLEVVEPGHMSGCIRRSKFMWVVERKDIKSRREDFRARISSL